MRMWSRVHNRESGVITLGVAVIGGRSSIDSCHHYHTHVYIIRVTQEHNSESVVSVQGSYLGHDFLSMQPKGISLPVSWNTIVGHALYKFYTNGLHFSGSRQ